MLRTLSESRNAPQQANLSTTGECAAHVLERGQQFDIACLRQGGKASVEGDQPRGCYHGVNSSGACVIGPPGKAGRGGPKGRP
jgi:hypothetical protein